MNIVPFHCYYSNLKMISITLAMFCEIIGKYYLCGLRRNSFLCSNSDEGNSSAQMWNLPKSTNFCPEDVEIHINMGDIKIVFPLPFSFFFLILFLVWKCINLFTFPLILSDYIFVCLVVSPFLISVLTLHSLFMLSCFSPKFSLY